MHMQDIHETKKMNCTSTHKHTHTHTHTYTHTYTHIKNALTVNDVCLLVAERQGL